MRRDQAELVGCRERHITGFRSFISFELYVNDNVKPKTCLRYIADVTKI